MPMSLKPALRLISLLLGCLLLNVSFAEEKGAEATEGAKPFNAGELIMEHIGNSHDWHIVGHYHLPLPIILKVPGGWEFFISSSFVEGEVHGGAHGAYALRENKVVAVDANGVENEEATGHILDLSLTKIACSIILSVVLLCLIMFSVAGWYKRNPNSAPKGLAAFMEPIILFVRDDIARKSIGEKKFERFVPYLLTLFFFIWINNVMGLIPIFPFGANVTGNIVTPLTLAVITLLIVTVIANWHYWRHMLAMPGIPVAVLFILTPIEVMGHFIRPFVLMIRLFANIMAGHIVLLVFFCLIFIFGAASVSTGYIVGIPALAFSIFINCLELLVAALQAYVFTLLTSIYIGTAVAGGHDHDHH